MISQHRILMPGGSTRAGRRKVYRSLLSMDRAGHAEVLDMNCGVVMGAPIMGPVEHFRELGITKDKMLSFLFGDEKGGRAQLSMAMYPDATKENITPKPEDFVAADFRLITATVVGAWSWKATDFSNEKVLRGSVSMLDRKPIFTNHHTYVENWVGIVSKPVWQAAGMSKGVKVPPGINATLLIDSKTRPEIARGVMLGSINSNSVTVEFEWEMSHDFEEERDFLYNIGNAGKDGEMIRRVVTKITGYHETSLVWLGADPFAKSLDPDGKLTSVDKGHVYNKEVPEEQNRYTKEHRFTLSFDFDPGVVRLAHELRDTPPAPTTTPDMKPEVIAALLALMGLSKAEDVTPAHVADLMKKDPTLAAKGARFTKLCAVGEASTAKLESADDAAFDTFVKDNTIVSAKRHGELVQAEVELKELKAKGDPVELSRKVSELNAANTTLAADAEVGKSFVEAKRAKVIAMYRKAAGDKADQAVIDMYKAADSKTLDGLLKKEGKEAVVHFSAYCTTCKTADGIEYRSSLEDADDKETVPQGNSIADIRERRLNRGFNLRDEQQADKK